LPVEPGLGEDVDGDAELVECRVGDAFLIGPRPREANEVGPYTVWSIA
jgi:hypothetical protein